MQDKLNDAIDKRLSLMSEPHVGAFRLFNGFTEGIPQLVFEIFAKTLVCLDYSPVDDTKAADQRDAAIELIKDRLPWLKTGLLKQRKSKEASEKNGTVIFGEKADNKIKEDGVWHAVNLSMNQDASFYLDTAELRHWMRENLTNKSVLNTFAYTGSLGTAALVGGASEVLHLDLNRNFLNMAKRSAELNGFEVKKQMYQTGDFWSRIHQYKKAEKRFDCVVLDPPLFAKTPKGRIDIVNNYTSLINKVRPLISDGGYLITISNALFQTGEDHHQVLTKLCEDGYLSIEKLVSVPSSFIGNPELLKSDLPSDPAPYNHSTKITILNVKRK